MGRGRGSNPRSHFNKPAIGGKKRQVRLTDEQWELVGAIGANNFSEGVRKMCRAIQANKSSSFIDAVELLQSFGFLDDGDESPQGLQKALEDIFPSLSKGRKNSADLVSELLLGESYLDRILVSELLPGELYLDYIDETLCRIVQVVQVTIAHPTNPKMQLMELRQEWGDRVVERGLVGISEKILGGEEAIAAAKRGMKEELKIEPLSLEFVEKSQHLNTGSAYQGIASYTELYRFVATIAPEDFQGEYREIGEKKTTVFGWV